MARRIENETFTKREGTLRNCLESDVSVMLSEAKHLLNALVASGECSCHIGRFFTSFRMTSVHRVRTKCAPYSDETCTMFGRNVPRIQRKRAPCSDEARPVFAAADGPRLYFLIFNSQFSIKEA